MLKTALPKKTTGTKNKNTNMTISSAGVFFVSILIW